MDTVTRDVSLLLSDLRDADPDTRRGAAEALGERRDESAVPHLINLFGDTDPGVGEAAVQALVRIGGEAVVNALSRAPRAGKAWERAARTLGKLATPATVAMLGDALLAGSYDTAMTACLALVDAGGVAGSVLIRALRHPSMDVRARAAMALGRAQVHDALDALMQAAGDPESSVRLEALVALAALKDDRAVPALAAALDDADDAVKQSVPIFLGEIGTPRAVEVLRQAARSEDEAVRWTAEWQLNEMLKER
jgi:HEAT repeat protein